ncbi:MAG: cellulose binding domain-containing protein [Xenococcaceae cyanobacterium]
MTLTNQYDKIVFNFDGNNNDVDDIGAMPMAGLLASSAGIENKTTFFYDNNLSETNEDFKVDKMRSSAAMVEKLGIDTVDYQQNIDAATDKLINIFNSGQKVLVIEGGPMEATYRALDETSDNNLSNITLLSHSTWNEERDVITKSGVTEARTWDDIKENFPEINTIHIADQNGDDNSGDKGFYSKDWNWLDSKDDSVYKDARERMEDSGKKNDLSDAGMLFYAITGDEYGDPWDAKSFLETNPPPEEGDSTSPTSEPTPTNNNNDYEIKVEYSVETTWDNNISASIDFTNQGDSFQGWTMEFEADYEITKIDNAEILSHQGDKYVIGDVSSNDNVYGGEITTFSFEAEGNSAEAKDWEFNGEELDSKQVETSISNDSNSSSPTSPTNNNSWKIEAEDMQLDSYKVESNDFASGNNIISLFKSGNDTGTASFEFQGGTGQYDIIIDAFDENDGEGEIKLAQNDRAIGDFDLNRDLGSNVADSTTDVSLEIKDVFVSAGDNFSLTGIADGSNDIDFEWARIDVVEFVPVAGK